MLSRVIEVNRRNLIKHMLRDINMKGSESSLKVDLKIVVCWPETDSTNRNHALDVRAAKATFNPRRPRKVYYEEMMWTSFSDCSEWRFSLVRYRDRSPI